MGPGSGCIRRCWTRCCTRLAWPVLPASPATGMLVPFAWSGVVLHAAGAGVLRARLRTGQGRALSRGGR